MMDDIKVEPNAVPWTLPQDGRNAVDCLSMGGNLLNGIKLEHEDLTYDLVLAVKCETPSVYSAVKNEIPSAVKCEKSPIPITFRTIKCEPKVEFSDFDIVKEEFLLDVTTEDTGSTNRPEKQHCHYDVRIREGAKRNIAAQHIGSADYVRPMDNSSSKEQLQFFGKSFIPPGNLEKPEPNDLQFKSLLCNYCGKSFTGKKAFLTHTLTHKKDELYMCEVCERSFQHKRFLANHMLSHTANRPFKCDICEMAYKTRSNLVRHKFTHMNKSQMCQKLSSQKRNRVTHTLTHTAEGPYRCVICNMGFKEKQKLWVHTSLTHLM